MYMIRKKKDFCGYVTKNSVKKLYTYNIEEIRIFKNRRSARKFCLKSEEVVELKTFITGVDDPAELGKQEEEEGGDNHGRKPDHRS